MDNNEFISRLADSQDKMAEDIGEIKISIITHIKRTNLLEESVALNRDENRALFKKLEADIAPVRTHIAILNLILKLFGGLSVIIGFIAGVAKIIEFISK